MLFWRESSMPMQEVVQDTQISEYTEHNRSPFFLQSFDIQTGIIEHPAVRDQLLGHLNDFCEHKHSPGQSAPRSYFQLFSLSLFVFDFLDLPDVMPEVGHACSLI